MESKKQLNYAKEEISAPNYQLTLVTQQSGGNQVTLNTTGGNQSIFLLPSAEAFNLSKSVLQFSYTIPAGAAFVNAYVNCIPLIQQFTLYTANGLALIDITNFHQFSKVIYNTDLKIDDLLTQDQNSLNVRNNQSVAVLNGGAGAPANTVGAIRPSGGTVTALVGTNTSAANLNYLEQAYIIQSATTAALTIYCYIPFRLFKNTIMSLNKDLFFNEQLQLRIIWGPYTRAGFQTATQVGTSNANPPVSDVTALNTAFNINNLNLYVAIEKNLSVKEALRNQVNSDQGLSSLFDYCWVYKQNFSATSNTQSLTYRFDRSHGMRLKRIYNSVFNGSEAKNNQFDNANSTSTAASPYTLNPGVVISQYFTQLDSDRQQQFNVDCTQYLDWMLHQDKLANSLMQNANVYQFNWAHIDSWDNMRLVDHDDNAIAGIPLDSQRTWYFNALNAPANWSVNHLTIAVCQRMIVINKSGVTIV